MCIVCIKVRLDIDKEKGQATSLYFAMKKENILKGPEKSWEIMCFRPMLGLLGRERLLFPVLWAPLCACSNILDSNLVEPK